LLYDGDCPLCRSQMVLLERLDWFSRVRCMPLDHPERANLTETPKAELMAAIHAIDPRGRIHKGVWGLRRIGLRIPLLAPMCLLLWLPGAIWIADRLYRQVAQNRYLLSRWFGCRDACELPLRAPTPSSDPKAPD